MSLLVVKNPCLMIVHKRLVNGFSNQFWGWGGEDDDMADRIIAHNLTITRPSPDIARYCKKAEVFAKH